MRSLTMSDDTLLQSRRGFLRALPAITAGAGGG
ncbi:MAG: twin-arginine translocation signal domain-containing protein, partial [Thiobacillus sp.]